MCQMITMLEDYNLRWEIIVCLLHTLKLEQMMVNRFFFVDAPFNNDYINMIIPDFIIGKGDGTMYQFDESKGGFMPIKHLHFNCYINCF